MRHLILSLFLFGSVMAADNEIDVLAFGVSHHFQNRDEYQFNELNPGVGLQYWHKIDEYHGDHNVHTDVGLVVAEYKNSYSNLSVVYGGMVKAEWEINQDWHWNLQVGVAEVTGYYPSGVGLIGAVSIGYKRVNLDATFMPYTPNDKGAPPSSAAVAVWLRINVCEW